jgi:LysR family glycine cleavage system transcriptional activator
MGIARTLSRALDVGPLRTFLAVAERLSFSEAGRDLHLTQSAVSRQIRALEDEIGTPLFTRGTRHVALTASGQALRSAAQVAVARIDEAVLRLRTAHTRRHVSVTTFASFASLWLLPRLPEFQAAHPDIDIRISATDALVPLDDPEIDLALRCCRAADAPPQAERLFGEMYTPVVSPRLAEQAAAGAAARLQDPVDLAQHALLEEDDRRPIGEFASWRRWLQQQDLATLEPRRWTYLNYTYQQVQAALAGQGVALARLPLVAQALQRGELIEPFGTDRRLQGPFAYWLVPMPEARNRADLRAFAQWLRAQAADTRAAIGEQD